MFAMLYPCTKSEESSFTYCRDMQEGLKFEICGNMRQLGSSAISLFGAAHRTSSSPFVETVLSSELFVESQKTRVPGYSVALFG